MEAMARRARANEEEHRRRCEYAEVRDGGADGRGGWMDGWMVARRLARPTNASTV